MRTALVIAWILTLGACSGMVGHAPSNVIVHVANEMAATGGFQWQSEGLLGLGLFRATEHKPFSGCAIYARGVGPGLQTVRISLGEESLTLTLDAAPDDSQMSYVRISSTGAISEIDAVPMPADPCSHVPPS